MTPVRRSSPALSARSRRYGHAAAVAELVRGYHCTAMAEQDHREARALRLRQAERAAEEARNADEAVEHDETRVHERRSEKAAYLRDKLAQAERATQD